MVVDEQDSIFSDIFTKLNLVVPLVSVMKFSDLPAKERYKLLASAINIVKASVILLACSCFLSSVTQIYF